MSQPQVSPKQNLMNSIMLAMVMFMGYMLISNAFKPQTDSRTFADVQKEMKKLNRELKDVSITQLHTVYDRKLAEYAEKEKLPAEEREWLNIQGVLLVVDTRIKSAAVNTGAISRLNMAFTMIAPLQRKHRSDDLWRRPLEVAPTPQYSRSQVTGEQLYDELSGTLSTANRTDLVYGLFPGYKLIDFLVGLTGRIPAFSYAFAALLLAVLVRAAVWPLTQKQLMFGRQMMQLQPLIKEVEAQYKAKDSTGSYRNTPEYQQKVMSVYKEYGINPMAGCFPALIQMPLFLAVYQCMLHYRFEFHKGTFLWINPSLSDATHGFVARNLGDHDVILLVLYGVSMIISTYLAPVSDPNNLRQQRMMGIGMSLVFTIMMFFWYLPAAFPLYWTFTNVLSTLQSLRANRMPVPPLRKVNAPNGGLFPMNGTNGNGMSNGSLFGKNGGPKITKSKSKR